MSNIGRVVFGPTQTPEEAERMRKLYDGAYGFKLVNTDPVNLCNCIGPQPGETKCRCALLAEIEQGRKMVRDGVVISGVEYELVPRKAR